MMGKDFFYLGWYLLLCVPIIIVYINYSSKAKREWGSLLGQAKPEVMPEEDKREYIRLESAFPVEFQKMETERESDVRQGFTKNLSRNGLCLEALTLHDKKLEDLVPNETKLRLIINIPPEVQPTVASATIRWIRKSEDLTIDRYAIGVSYDDIAEPDLEKILKYALWLRRRPDILAVMLVIISMLIAVLFSSAVIFKREKHRLQTGLQSMQEKVQKLEGETAAIRREKEEAAEELKSISAEYVALWDRLKDSEKEREYQQKRFALEKKKPEFLEAEPKAEEEKSLLTAEETAGEEAVVPEEDISEEPVVELRETVEKIEEDEIMVEPNITRKMIEKERDLYNAFRDYILKEEIQLLDRYCSEHRTSIYHAAGLFSLAELRYKAGYIKEMTKKAYRDVIMLYPRSKYASYASHRLDQIERNLPYTTYSLRYFYLEYNLPPLFDYRELEPYKSR